MRTNFSQSLMNLKERINTLTIKCAVSPDFGTLKARETQYLKYRKFIAQKGKCCFCDIRMLADADSSPLKQIATKEHIIPKCRGGSDKEENIALSCWECNNIRGITKFEKFSENVKNRRIIAAQVRRDAQIRRHLKRVAKKDEANLRLFTDPSYRARILEVVKSNPEAAKNILKFHQIDSVQSLEMC